MAAQQVGHRLLFLKSMRSWNNRPDEPRFRRTERYTMPSSSFSSNLHREATEDEGQQDLGVPTLEIPMYASDGHTLVYVYGTRAVTSPRRVEKVLTLERNNPDEKYLLAICEKCLSFAIILYSKFPILMVFLP
ncbi:hypothetical protein V1478_001229 [Vespula squamosa]|uniref:Uncharacterized protein n=1 Tax=Vespula squamosa TaxID=30214 RepID=A0ABD2C7R4_VESSQ